MISLDLSQTTRPSKSSQIPFAVKKMPATVESIPTRKVSIDSNWNDQAILKTTGHNDVPLRRKVVQHQKKAKSEADRLHPARDGLAEITSGGKAVRRSSADDSRAFCVFPPVLTSIPLVL